MKVEFEKNASLIKTLSLFLVTAAKVYIDHSIDTGANIPIKVFLVYTLFPVIYILIYPLFSTVKQKIGRHDEYFKFINDLTHLNFVLLGLFIFVLITQEFWHNASMLMPLIYIFIYGLITSASIIFLSLLVLWIINFNRKEIKN